MSYIPNSAMPHAYADNDEADSGIDWQAYLGQARDLARRGFGLVRTHPREAAAGAAAVLGALALAGWRASRRKRRIAFA